MDVVLLVFGVHKTDAKVAHVGVQQHINQQIIAVGVHYMVQLAGVQQTHADMLNIVLHRKEILFHLHKLEGIEL